MPLTGDRLIQVLLAIDDTSLAGQRDIALLLTGWYGAFRRSELSQMRRTHLSIDEHGVGIEVPRSKTAQDHSVWVPILRQTSSRWDASTHQDPAAGGGAREPRGRTSDRHQHQKHFTR